MKEKKSTTDQTVDACCAKNEAEVLREIKFFIGRFFLTETEHPTEDDIKLAHRLAELTITMMAQMLNLSVRERQIPFFNAMFYVKDMGGGVGKVNYAFETQGGPMFEQLGLGVMGQKLEEAIGNWCEEVWGGKLTTQAAEFLQQWGNVVK
jgi:hypothetical protein